LKLRRHVRLFIKFFLVKDAFLYIKESDKSLVAGAEGLHQDLNLPYLGGKRTSLPARLNPIPLINQSIPVQSTNSSLIGRSNPPNSFMKPVLNKNQQTSDLRNAYIGPPRGPNIPVTLENRFPQKQARNFQMK